MISLGEIDYYALHAPDNHLKNTVISFCVRTQERTELLCCMVHRAVQEYNRRTCGLDGSTLTFDAATSRMNYHLNSRVGHEPWDAVDVRKIMVAVASDTGTLRDEANILDIISTANSQPRIFRNCDLPVCSTHEMYLSEVTNNLEDSCRSDFEAVALQTTRLQCSAFVIVEDLCDDANTKVYFKCGTHMCARRRDHTSQYKYTTGLVGDVILKLIQ
jgi:hypothetical protein